MPASARQSQNVPASYPRRIKISPSRATQHARLQGFSSSPLTNSNRRPPPYHGGVVRTLGLPGVLSLVKRSCGGLVRGPASTGRVTPPTFCASNSTSFGRLANVLAHGDKKTCKSLVSRRSRKPLGVVRLLEGSNPSLSASARNRMFMRFLSIPSRQLRPRS
jgi:hypothetical protein